MISGGTDTEASHNSGENKLIECLSILEIPLKYTMLSKMDEVRTEINTIEKHGKKLFRSLCVSF